MLAPLSADDPREVGPYRLQGRIGAGGMGTVYLGFGADSRAVAVKVASPLLADDAEFRERFGREVTAAQRVRGKAIANVIDADTDASAPWMATEYVDGVSLADAVRRRGRLEQSLVRGFAVGLLDALIAIHEAGIVHRDLKPSNILLSWDGPKVIDFGIAHLVDAVGLTRTGHVIGTLAWMAPEQMRGDAAVAATDVFAWGTCVTFAATGRHPFHAERQEVLAYRVQAEEPQLGDLPGYLVGPVSAALTKDVARRPTAADLMADMVGRGVDVDQAAGELIEKTWIGSTPARAIVTSSPSDGAGREVPWYSVRSGEVAGPGSASSGSGGSGSGGSGSGNAGSGGSGSGASGRGPGPGGSGPGRAAGGPGTGAAAAASGSWWSSQNPTPSGAGRPGSAGTGPAGPPARTGQATPPGAWPPVPGATPPSAATPPPVTPPSAPPPPGGQFPPSRPGPPGAWSAQPSRPVKAPPAPAAGSWAATAGTGAPAPASWGGHPPGSGMPGPGVPRPPVQGPGMHGSGVPGPPGVAPGPRPGYPYPVTPRNSQAQTSLVLGVISAVFGWTIVFGVAAVFALVLGRRARDQISQASAAGRPQSGAGQASAGIALGAVGLLEALIILLVVIAQS